MPSNSVAFDRAVDYYDDTRGFPPGQEQFAAGMFVVAGGLTADSHVLEIGVGTGRIALPLAPYTHKYFGADLSIPMMERLLAKRDDEPIALMQADVTRLPLADHSVDAVVAVHVFHLIPGWRAVLAELARVLRPGGILMHGWNDRAYSDPLETAWKRLREARPAENTLTWDERSTFLLDAGWQPAGETLRHHYTTTRPPLEYLENLKRRIWSHTWRMTDEEIAEGAAVVEAYIAEHFDDPRTPYTAERAFAVDSFRPPQG